MSAVSELRSKIVLVPVSRVDYRENDKTAHVRGTALVVRRVESGDPLEGAWGEGFHFYRRTRKRMVGGRPEHRILASRPEDAAVLAAVTTWFESVAADQSNKESVEFPLERTKRIWRSVREIDDVIARGD